MATVNPTIVIGTASARAEHGADLGKTITANGKTYRMVKANAAIAAAANKAVVRTSASAWTVNTTTTGADPLIAGIIPNGQKGSDGSTGLVSGDYFYLQVSGDALALVSAASVAAGSGLASHTAAGQVAAIDATFAATDPGTVVATLLETSVIQPATSRVRLNGGLLA